MDFIRFLYGDGENVLGKTEYFFSIAEYLPYGLFPLNSPYKR